MEDKRNRTRWLITIEDSGRDQVPANARLKRFLKYAWRGYGLRCTSITQEHPVRHTETPLVRP